MYRIYLRKFFEKFFSPNSLQVGKFLCFEPWRRKKFLEKFLKIFCPAKMYGTNLRKFFEKNFFEKFFFFCPNASSLENFSFPTLRSKKIFTKLCSKART